MSNVKATDRRLERLDRLISDLQQRYESLKQDRLNRRLGVMGIVAGILFWYFQLRKWLD